VSAVEGKMIVGIDLGTTNSAIAVWLDGRPQLIPNSLGSFRSLSPGSFDPRAQEWWSRFFNRPHIRPGLLRGAAALTLAGVLFGGLAGADNNCYGMVAFSS
jgi:molecular chaperone HscC